MKNNKILAAVLAGVLASCSDTKTEPTATPTSKPVNGLTAVQLSGNKTWAALKGATNLNAAAVDTFDVNTDAAKLDANFGKVTAGFSNVTAASDWKAGTAAITDFSNLILVMQGEIAAAAPATAVTPAETLTLLATDTANDINLQGLKMVKGNTVTITGAASKTVALGVLSTDGDATTEIKMTTAGTLQLDTALIKNAKIIVTDTAVLAFAKYAGGKDELSLSKTILDTGAVVTSASDITIPEGYTVVQQDAATVTATGKAITNAGTHTLTGGTVTAAAYTNTGTLTQDAGTITAATFTNGQAAGTDATANPAISGTHTMTGGLVTGAYSNLAGSVSLNTGAKIDGAFTNAAGAKLTIDGNEVKAVAEVKDGTGKVTTAKVDAVAASTITGLVANQGALTMTGGVLAGDVTNSAKGKVEISGGELQKTFTSTGTDKDNRATVTMSGGKVTGITTNGAFSDFTMTGGELAAALTNAGTFIVSGAVADVAKTDTTAAVKATKVHSVTNTGTYVVKGGATGAFQNGENGVFTFDSKADATVGAVTVDAAKVNTFNFTTGKTLTTGTVALNAATVINLTLGAGAGTAAAAPTVSLISATGAVNLAAAKITVKASQDIAAGSVFKLVTTDTAMAPANIPTIDATVDATMTKDGTAAYDLSKLTLAAAVDNKSLTLTVTDAIKYKAPAAPVSNIIAGGFRSSVTAAQAQKIAGTSFAFVNDAALANGKFDGTFAFQNASTFAGLAITHSVAATSKALTESSFNDASFMTSISKDLGSNGFTFAPSIALGVVQAFGVNASAEVNGSTFSVRDASNSSLLAEVGFTSSTSFKFSGVEFGATASASVASKSGDQTFNMTNAFGDVMLGQAAKSNVALSFGVSAKLDATTSFYATAKTASYNNSKAIEVGVRF